MTDPAKDLATAIQSRHLKSVEWEICVACRSPWPCPDVLAVRTYRADLEEAEWGFEVSPGDEDPRPTGPQEAALRELAEHGTCWPSRRTGQGWVNGKTAGILMDHGWAERRWVGVDGVSSGRGNVGGTQFLYRITERGRRVLDGCVS